MYFKLQQLRLLIVNMEIMENASPLIIVTFYA
jgi:hypothetical protein